MLVPHFLARSLIGLWLDTSPQSWKRRVIANDSPHVHAPGTNPDRVLLLGDGVATGRGVITHELGLPGYLARALSARTGHATDVDTAVNQELTVGTCIAATDDLNLTRYDIIIASIGHNEALSLMTPRRWRDGLNDLLDHLERQAPAATRISILAIPSFGPMTALPAYLARVVDRHAHVLNAITATEVETRPRVTLITTGSSNQFEAENTRVYRLWADHVALTISADLAADRIPASDTASMDEMHRQLALEELELSGTGDDDVLDDLVQSARNIFGTPIAAITLVHSDYLTTRAIAGMEPRTVRRSEAFCDTTIRRASHLVIEDAAADPRYADYPIVTQAPGVRFYAGYPIESPDGYPVGAFCVMDTDTRAFTTWQLQMLRSLAQLAENRLWPEDRAALAPRTG